MAPAPAPPRAGGCSLPVGTAVRLHGLKTVARLNGQAGVCVGWDEASGRVHVKLPDGEVKAFKPSNLWKVQSQSKVESAQVERVKSLFRKYDTNGDGVIDQTEFKRFMQALGLQPSCLGEFMRHVDRDGDGAIQYEEFVDWVLSDDPLTIPSEKKEGDAAESEEQPSVTLPANSFNSVADTVDDSDSDDDARQEAKDLTTDEVAELCGGLPYGWPENGIKIVNNMRRRFPDFPVQRIVAIMKQQGYHGGNVIQGIRRAGAQEVQVMPPSVVTCGRSGRKAFPALYQVRPRDPNLNIYEQSARDFSFHNLRLGRLEPVGSIKSGERFRIIEVRRDNEYGFCFGRVYFGTIPERYHWVNLGKELKLSRSLMGTDLQFTGAERLDPA
mmetsp:Transcript_23105/g.66327  ORF Transcript_23105/g.66327 Transcript_23105/m.66327 type:complete len:384 (-) Transcript_23105:292-1443(-)